MTGIIRKKMRYAPLYLFMILSSLVMFLPILITLFTALRPMGTPLDTPWLPPLSPTWENFVSAWVVGHFNVYFVNSLLISTVDSLLMVLIAYPAAYALAIFSFRLSKGILVLFLMGIIIPPITIILPLFTAIRDLGLYNNHFGVILADIALALPPFVLIIRSFLVTLPPSLRESAVIDGAGEIRLMLRIFLPLSMPVVYTTILLEFLWSWSDLLLRLVFLSTDSTRTLTVGLLNFMGQYTRNVTGVAAAAVIMSLPIIVMFIIFRRQFIYGLSSGAVKE